MIAPWVGVAVSLLILLLTSWSLYLSHYKEHRSEISLLPQDSANRSEFSGGNHALGEDARWNGYAYLKVINTGEQGGYVTLLSHDIIGFRDGSEIASSTDITLEERTSSWSPHGDQIAADSTERVRFSFSIEPEEDISEFLDHERLIIEHALTVEDNKGSYEVTQRTEMALTGPDGIREKYERRSET